MSWRSPSNCGHAACRCARYPRRLRLKEGFCAYPRRPTQSLLVEPSTSDAGKLVPLRANEPAQFIRLIGGAMCGCSRRKSSAPNLQCPMSVVSPLTPRLSVSADIPVRQQSASSGREQVQQSRGYSIVSSAVASSVAGTSRPSAFAVLRLITSSYLVGACTGRSAGFLPLRMRST